MANKKKAWTATRHVDAADVVLMAAGILGSIGDGLVIPIMFAIRSWLMNDVGITVSDASVDLHLVAQSINKNALLLCKLAAAAWMCCFLEGYCWTRTAERQAARIQAQYMSAVLRQDIAYFDTRLTSASDVIACVSSDNLIIQDCISDKVPDFLMNVSMFIGSYVVAFVLLWRLAVVTLPSVVLLVVPGIVYGRVLITLAKKMRDEYGKAGCVAEEAMSSVRTVYAFVGEHRTVLAFSKALEGLLSLGLKQGLAKAFALGANGLTFAIWSFSTWYGTRLVMYHGAKGGSVFAAGVCINLGGMAFGSCLSNLKYFSEAYSAGQRISEMIRRVPDIDSDDTDGKILEEITGDVEFKHVKFAYPSRPETLILREFSLRVPAGKTVALVGGSGSGKSTVISLLQRFYSPLGGEILLDGVGIDELQLKWLRSQMGLVSQEPVLFGCSVKENILYGKEDATMEDIIEASKASNAHGFITQLPRGYDTQVGERGIQLSGGQKQRIAIARAIIRNPCLLLLDEATSALDSESEHVVQEALDRVSANTTTIVIAHRLSTIRHAHIISVVQAGQIVESGSHDDLVHLSQGIYSSLLQRQHTQLPKDDQHHQTHQDHQFSAYVEKDHLGITASVGSPSPRRTKVGNTSFRRLAGFSLPEWKMGLLGCLSAVVSGAVQPIFSAALGAMVQVMFLPNHEEINRQSRVLYLAFAGMSVLALASNAIQHYSFANVGEKLTARMREKMLTAILRFEIGWFDREENSSAAICSRLAKDANAVRSLVGERISSLVQALTALLISSVLGFIISWRLALVMIAAQPIITASIYSKRVLLVKMSQKSQKSQEKSSNLASEAFSNIRTITSFSSQSRILNMLKKEQIKLCRDSVRQSWYIGLGLAASVSLMLLSTTLSFWYGGRLLVQGHINARKLFQTITIFERVSILIGQMGSMTSDLAKGTNAIQSVFAVLDRVTQIEPDELEGKKSDHTKGHIEIQGVDFAYPSRPSVMVFEGFSLDIQAGKSTALVGRSGSGKSTIVGLIERFYDPLHGAIKIDGCDIRTYRLRSLRKHMALVSQEPTLFTGTIRENIAYGSRDDIDETELVEAAKAADAHEFISALKDGYDTWCGNKGAQLSGGQKQRIAIARAILKDPRILLLDEATSALDNQSERTVQRALEKMMVGRTSVVVAHRLSTIQNCDTIAVLEKGKIVEMGSHSCLMAKGDSGAYYSLVNLQTPL